MISGMNLLLFSDYGEGFKMSSEICDPYPFEIPYVFFFILKSYARIIKLTPLLKIMP